MLKLSELYSSVQGEGPLTGVPTQFVRFGGCNMRCPGWPCDSPYAVLPENYKEWEKVPADLLISRIIDEAERTGARNLCFTGGEPFLQPQEDLINVANSLAARGFTIEFYTNGSFVIPFQELPAKTRFMLDWKLTGSGEVNTNLHERWVNARGLNGYGNIKFVCKNADDLMEAKELTEDLYRLPTKATLWVGSAWDQLSEADIVAFMLIHKMPWRLNVQVHKYVWPSEMRGI